MASDSAPSWMYDVFLSFRGADTRKGFVAHLYNELQRLNLQRITTFKDDQDLEGGSSIPLELPTAIKESHIAIVVISPNYASSKWCLNELTTILQCMEARNTVFPVFYGVDPSDVGNQRGSFAQAFTDHEEKFISTHDKKMVAQWKADLKKVSKISGWPLKNFNDESELIQDLVKCVLRKVQRTRKLVDSSEKFVGIDSGLEQLRSMLAHDVNDVRFIGITGMGGIGKTTLAKLIFDEFFHHFEVQRFLSNVREVSARDRTLVGLQRQLLSLIISKEDVLDEQWGSIHTRKCFRNKKALLVLDDVDHLKQLEILAGAGSKDWFGKGSRIIITTRNEDLLVQLDIEPTNKYKVEGLNYEDALELFSLNAFRKRQPQDDFLEQSWHFVGYAKGLPLALKVLGRSLYKKPPDIWDSKLKNLREIGPDSDIFDVLKISYDGLEKKERIVFLDVACCFKGRDKVRVIEMLDRIREFSSLSVIHGLVEKSLLTIEKSYSGYRIGMHDLIEEMGRRIVNEESEEPGQRSRLWRLEDISYTFRTNTGTREIEVIALKFPELKPVQVEWNCVEGLSKMDGLRYLEFDNLMISSPGPNFLPRSLRIIRWSWYPSESLPQSFKPWLLTELNLRHSNLVRLWDGIKYAEHLKHMNLSFCEQLTSTPDFAGIPCLEELNLRGCTNLVYIHSSIAVLKKLKRLDFKGCICIKSLPSELKMDSLKIFNLGRCLKLIATPDFTGVPNLEELNLGGCTKLESIHPSIAVLKKLRYLNMRGSAAESSVWSLVLSSLGVSLVKLDLSDCNICEGVIPHDFGRRVSSLQRLDLSGNNFVSLPASIRYLSKLESLKLERCEGLQQLPDLPPPNPSNKRLLCVNVDDCTSLKRLSDPSKLSRSANVYNFYFSCLNCVRLVEEKGWINRMFSRITEYFAKKPRFEDETIIKWPGSEIPKWFGQQSEGHSINVELPQPPQSCSNWIGIALCVIFEDQEFLDNPTALLQFDYFKIDCLWGGRTWFRKGHLKSQHLWVLYLSRNRDWDTKSSHPFVFETTYFDSTEEDERFGEEEGLGEYKTCANVKRIGARLVYKKDLEELKRTLKIFRRTQQARRIFKRTQRAMKIFKRTQRALKIFRRTQPALKFSKRMQPTLKFSKRMQPALKFLKRTHRALKFLKRTQRALKNYKRMHEYDDGDEATQPLCKRRKQ